MKKFFNTSGIVFDLQRFSDNEDNVDNVVASLNKTTSEGLSAENKEYYEKYLIDNAEPNLVHSQFGQKRSIPKGKGKTVEFRKYSPFQNANKLEEGITPKGESLNVTTVTATLEQYGAYVPVTDVVDMTAIDDNLVEATELLGEQAGRTLDAVVREVINGGTNVIFAGGAEGREAIGAALTVADIKKAVKVLKGQNAKKIDGSYVAIIHPYVSHDLTNDPEWIEAHKYSATTELFEGEIGKICGVRFVETTEAKVWENGSNYQETGDSWEGYDGIGLGEGPDVYSTLIIGKDAYGCINHENGNLKHIFKGFGSGGTADPLDQRATAGWKAMQTAVRLVETNMVRIESLATA